MIVLPVTTHDIGILWSSEARKFSSCIKLLSKSYGPQSNALPAQKMKNI